MELVRPSDSVQRQNEKLKKITHALMRRVEQAPDQAGLAYAQFERAALLEKQVRERTADLERTLNLLQRTNEDLERANSEANTARRNLSDAIEAVEEGFALFGDDDRLVMFNSRFCAELPDVRKNLSAKLDFGEYVALVSQSVFRVPEQTQTSEQWRSHRLKSHDREHTAFNLRLVRNKWLQISEHRTDTRGTVVLQTDITQVMRDEQRERKRIAYNQSQMLRATLDHLNQAVTIFDAQQRLMDWNRQVEPFLMRPVLQANAGMSFPRLVRAIRAMFRFPEDMPEDQLLAWAAKSTGRRPIRFEIRRTDNVVYDVFAQELPDGGFVLSFNDITKTLRTSQALHELNLTLEKRVARRTTELGAALNDARRANASKNRFVAAASHDLLQPLSAAKLYASSLEDRLPDSSDKIIASKAIDALTTAEALIDSLMDISKLDLGLADFQLEAVSLQTVFAALASESAPIAAKHGIELRVVGTSCVVISDAMYLRRILQNLLSNAIRYSVGPKVLIGVRRRGQKLRIDVVDQGPGISRENQTLIFQEFKKLSDAAASRDGLGLGLAIVERACKLLNHNLSLISAEGSSSRFSVEVDAAPTSGQIDQSELTAPLSVKPETRGRIVGLVENDPNVAESLTLLIEGYGSDVVYASNAKETLTLISDLGIVPDGFLVDYQLGTGMDGVELSRELQRLYGPVPIHIISASRATELAVLCENHKLPLIQKPIDRADLVSFLEGLEVQSARRSTSGDM